LRLRVPSADCKVCAKNAVGRLPEEEPAQLPENSPMRLKQLGVG
jgi:hypothetical protein